MEDGVRTFVFFRRPGPAWVRGKDTKEQPGWDEHARFMDALHDEGRVLLAGPYEDRSRVLIVVRCSSREEAEHVFDADPWTGMGILEDDGLDAWEAFLKPDGWPADP
jgi:uncharacterized protein YciI